MGGTKTFDDFLKRNNIDTPEPDELEHYGVKGMKWGVRRTPKQLARARGEKLPASKDAKQVRDLRSRKTATLSNDELRIINERLNLERNYIQLGGPRGSRLKRTGRKFVNDLFNNELKTLSRGEIDKTTSYRAGKAIFDEYNKRK